MTYLDRHTLNSDQEIEDIFSTLDEHFTNEDDNGETQPEDEPEPSNADEEQFGNGEPTPGETTPEGSDGVQPEGEPDNGEQETSPQSVSVNGREFSVAEITRYAEFERFLTNHPDVAARVVEAARGGQPAPIINEQVSTPTPPPEFDLDDPRDKFVWDTHVQTQQQLRDIQAYQQSTRVAQAEAQYAVATTFIKDKFKLNDADIVALGQKTADMNIIPGMVARTGDPVVAFKEALEYTYWATPEFREREINTKVSQQTQTVNTDRERQIKLDKVSNRSSGTRPQARQTKDPKNMSDIERREAMITEISEAIYSGA